MKHDNGAEGYLIVMIGGAMVFVEAEDWPGFENGKLHLPADRAYEVVMIQRGNEINVMVTRADRTAVAAKHLTIYGHAIGVIQRIGKEGVVYGTVVKARSGLLVANQMPKQGGKP